MNNKLTAALAWGLAVLAVALGHALYGWRGALLAFSAVVFWLLLQFTQAVRAMRQAAQTPVGQVPSALMLHARLHPGMGLVQIIQISRSLGRRLAEEPETWAWCDASGAEVRVVMQHGRCRHSTLHRPPAGAAEHAGAAAADEPPTAPTPARQFGAPTA